MSDAKDFPVAWLFFSWISLAFLDSGSIVISVAAMLFFLEVAIKATCEVHQEGVSLEEHSVAGSAHYGGNLTGSFDSTQLKESWWGREGVTEEFGSLSLTLSLNDCGAFVLDGLVDEILGSFSLLLGDLLLFNGLSELTSEMEVSDGDIIKDDVEVLQSFG